MKRIMSSLAGVLTLSLLMLGAAYAAETREEKALSKDAAEISKTASTEKGAGVVTQKIEKEFDVTEAQVTALRDKKLGYGEITIVFSLASKLPGGISDANVEQIMALRQGPPVMGWGEIAKKLGFKLGPAVSQVKTVARDTDREMEHMGKGEKGMKDNMGRADERRGEMGGHSGMGAGGQGLSHGKGN
jgi:hypothetical protein